MTGPEAYKAAWIADMLAAKCWVGLTALHRADASCGYLRPCPVDWHI